MPETLEGRVVAALKRAKRTLAVAESCTGGMLGERLTRIPGAGDVFLGGVISYTDGVKSKLLGIDPKLLEEKGAVTRVIAQQMATHVRERTGADLAVSITGFAGPNVPPGGELGLVYVGLAHARGVDVHELHLRDERQAVREGATRAALEYVLDHLARS